MERARAQQEPYADDEGPSTIDVSAYPAEMQETYRTIFMMRCQTCHSSARTLNAPFVEPYGPKADEAKKIARWKAKHPEWFQDPHVWQIEGAHDGQPGIWEVYLNRMRAKPGCELTAAEFSRLWDFLRYDSEHRKLGANAAAWAAERQKLLAQFKVSHPDRYRELYENH